MSSCEATRHVFVYGTLRRGEMNDIHRLQPAPRFVGMGQVRGTLYHLGAYPGLRLEGDTPVVGEVYAIAVALECQLDAIEEIRGRPDDEYVKREVTVTLMAPAGGSARVACAGGAPARSVRALLYEVQLHRIAGARVLSAGDWLQR